MEEGIKYGICFRIIWHNSSFSIIDDWQDWVDFPIILYQQWLSLSESG